MDKRIRWGIEYPLHTATIYLNHHIERYYFVLVTVTIPISMATCCCSKPRNPVAIATHPVSTNVLYTKILFRTSTCVSVTARHVPQKLLHVTFGGVATHAAIFPASVVHICPS
jgi:hypothetical protein